MIYSRNVEIRRGSMALILEAQFLSLVRITPSFLPLWLNVSLWHSGKESPFLLEGWGIESRPAKFFQNLISAL